MRRAQTLRKETALDSISPERAGSIMYDTLAYINQMQLQAANPLLISKIYASVAAMEADSAPVSDLTGQALRPGQVVCIVTEDDTDPDYGMIYRYDGTTGGTSSWTAVGKIGSSPYLEGYQFMGVATPATDPGNPDQKEYYIAGTPGKYAKFLDAGGNALEVGEGGLNLLIGTGSVWALKIASGQPIQTPYSAVFAPPGYIDAAGGVYVPYPGYVATDFIPVWPGQKLIYSGSAGRIVACVAGYSSADEADFVEVLLPGFQASSDFYDNAEFIVPPGVYFIRACHRTSDANPSLSLTTMDDGVAGARTIGGFYIKLDDGSYVRLPSYYATEFIAVQPGDKFYYSGRTGSVAAAVAGYDQAGDFVTAIIGASVNYVSPYEFTVPSGVYLIRACSSRPLLLIKETELFSYSGGNTLPNEYFGKLVNWLGDSITAGNFDNKVAAYFGMNENDYGINGSTIAKNSGDTRNSMAVRYASMDDAADVVVVSGGTNDYQYSWTPFGAMGDDTVDTFYGALDVLCRGLIAKYPNKLIFFTTPIKRNQNADGTGHRALDTEQDVPNSLGKYLADYAAAIKEVCAEYSIPVCDLYAESLLNPNITAQAGYFDNVGTHPDDTGTDMMARRVRGFMKQLC